MTNRRYVLDASVWRSPDGLLLTGGAPARLVRLAPAGRDVLEIALAGGRQTAPGAGDLLRRLLDGSLIHPAGAQSLLSRITFVIPVRNGAARLPALVRALLPYGRVIVVDDRSTDGSAAVAEQAGADVIANRRRPGPAAARNVGLEEAMTDLVAFVDDDCVVGPHWLEHLAGLFDDPWLAIAAPRVSSVPGPSRLARYEMRCSPLDLGPHPALVAPNRRLTFVPSAALLCRRAALLEVGAFDPQLRVGEDVDLVWRLVAAGWRVRYAPESQVRHWPRSTVRAMARQRFAYGMSAPLLQSRHPGAATPLHVASHTAGVWLTGVALGPVAAAGALAVSALAAAAAKPVDRGARGALAFHVARGHVVAARHLARVVVREWLPLTAVAAASRPRWRRAALAAMAVDSIAARGQPLLRVVDNTAYAAGLWRAAIGMRSAAALLLRPAPRP